MDDGDASSKTLWYLVQLKPNSFQIAERHLTRQGFCVFNPTEEKTLRKNGRFSKVLKPLFPGYFFVGLDPKAKPWRAINSTHGVTRLVMLGQKMPVCVPSDLISELMMYCGPQGRSLSVETLSPGHEVRVTNGFFEGFIAKIEAVSTDRRVWVLLDIMGRATKISVATKDIQRV